MIISKNSANLYQVWEIENTDTGSCTYQYNYQHNWNVSSNGGGSPSIVNAYDSMDTSHAFSDNINW